MKLVWKHQREEDFVFNCVNLLHYKCHEKLKVVDQIQVFLIGYKKNNNKWYQ